MFFDPKSYLERDPAGARNELEAARLRREAEQRARLCEAMTRRAAEVGFEATAATWVFAEAGLGSGTFYKLYGARDACLQEAFERCAETLLGRVADAARGGGEAFEERLEAGLGELLEVLGDEPEVARLLLVEVRAGDAACREVQQRWLARFAGLLDGGGSGGAARMAARALASLLALGLGSEGELAGEEALAELSWVGQLAKRGAEAESSGALEGAAAGGRARTAVAETPRREALARREQAQRERILAATAELAGRKGYKATQVRDILERARLSRPIFYAHFQGKEQCFLAACEAAIEPIFERVKEAVTGGGTVAERTEAGLRALLESFAVQPGLARLLTIEVRKVGAAGEAHYSDALSKFARLLAEAGDDRQAGVGGDVPRVVAGTVAGAIAREVAAGRAERLEGLLPELVFAALAPCLGGERAADETRRISEGTGDNDRLRDKDLSSPPPRD